MSELVWAAARTTVANQSSMTFIPKRLSIVICEIWRLQHRFHSSQEVGVLLKILSITLAFVQLMTSFVCAQKQEKLIAVNVLGGHKFKMRMTQEKLLMTQTKKHHSK